MAGAEVKIETGRLRVTKYACGFRVFIYRLTRIEL